MPKKTKYFQPPNVPKYEDDRRRKEDKAFYNGKHWLRCRAGYIASHPLCSECESGYHVQVHHIKDRRLFPELQYDHDNLKSLCRSCHMAERFKQNETIPDRPSTSDEAKSS